MANKTFSVPGGKCHVSWTDGSDRNMFHDTLTAVAPMINRATWDRFAAAALREIMAGRYSSGGWMERPEPAVAARLSYDQADAMMVEREKRLRKIEKAVGPMLRRKK